MKPQPDPIALRELVRKAKQGDAEALGSLIRETQSRMLRFCLLLCHDRTLAQDLLQDTYVRALDELGRLKDPDKLVSWLHKIARNLFLDHIKSPRNAPSEALDPGGIEPTGAGDALRAPGDVEQSMQLAQTLAAIEPDDRALLLLVDLEEYTYKEAAEIIGITEANVRFRLHHIRKEFINKYGK